MSTATEEAPATEQAPRVLSSDQGFWTIAWRQFSKDRISITGLVVCALLAALAVFAPFIANGKPFSITGVLTNFYSNDVAAFRDWHQKYREVADDLLTNAKRLSPAERVEKEGQAELYRDGLPKILERMGSYMKAEDAAALRETTKAYIALLAVPAPELDRTRYEQLGTEIEDNFGTLAFEPAYKRVSGPLIAFAYPPADGTPSLLKRAQDAQEEARYAKEDNDPKALAAAEKKLEALAPELGTIAGQVETNGKSMASFLAIEEASALRKTAAELGATIRALARPTNDDLVNRYNDLASRIDAFARRPVAPDRQRIPRTTLHPVVDYLVPKEVFFVVLYVTVVLVIVFRRSFLRLTALLPLDPSDLGPARLGAILAPALLVSIVWWIAVPEREPPSDTYYKSFAEELVAHPDPESSITFAPIPYGENENLQYDKVSPPTWCEDVGHLVKRLREPDKPLPPGVTEDQLAAWMEPHETPRKEQPQHAVILPWAKDLVSKRLTRSRYHWIGTDKGGRDVCARIIIGSRISLSVGFVSVGLNVLIGIVLGSIAGYFRGWVDIAVSRFTEILMCIPSFFLILSAIVVLQRIPAIWAIMLVLGLVNWTSEMRLVRGEFLRLVGLDFVTAGKALGLSNARVIFRHMLPNAMAPVLVAATFGVAGAILTESGLSFLGFGIQPPGASWGSVLNEAFENEKDMWWVTVFPGFMIFLTITAYNLVGEGFRDATDPRLRK